MQLDERLRDSVLNLPYDITIVSQCFNAVWPVMKRATFPEGLAFLLLSPVAASNAQPDSTFERPSSNFRKTPIGCAFSCFSFFFSLKALVTDVSTPANQHIVAAALAPLCLAGSCCRARVLPSPPDSFDPYEPIHQQTSRRSRSTSPASPLSASQRIPHNAE